MPDHPVTLRIARDLQFFLAPRRRHRPVQLAHDGTSTLGHLVQSVGVPLTEVGEMRVADRVAPPSTQPASGAVVSVSARGRPQPTPTWPPRFLLDVHLGTLARWLRLVGLDAAYRNDRDDARLASVAAEESRVLLSKDRGLLQRRAVRAGAYVRGDRPDDQLADVLDRFAPPLRPWTRCLSCGGPLCEVSKSEVAGQLRPGTRRTYDAFARCAHCGQVYWHGAHADRLDALVAEARRVVDAPHSGDHERSS